MNRKNAKRRGVSTKALSLILAVVMIVGVSVGATLAWLTDKTESVVNTFTYGDINITLKETKDLDLKMIPGNDITKDPQVAVLENSEACWLFVKIDMSENYSDYLAAYVVADGWTKLEDGVYYRSVDADTAKVGASYGVLKDNKVTVLNTVTKDMMEEIKDGTVAAPTLTFTAYAVQSANVADAAAAWAIATA